MAMDFGFGVWSDPGKRLGPTSVCSLLWRYTVRNGSKILKFADGIKVIRQIRSTEDEVDLQLHLDFLSACTQENKMVLHPSKCTFCVLGREEILDKSTTR